MNRQLLLQARDFFRFSTQFNHSLNKDYLKKLQRVMGQELKINEDIDYNNDVRLIDKNNKLIGVFSMEQARRKAKSDKVDLVMINPDVKPPVCKMTNYSEELGSKYFKDIVGADRERKEKKISQSTKLIKLGSKISIQDLKVKSNIARDTLKKASQIRVEILCTPEDVSQSSNILMTFKDLCANFMTPQGQIHIRDREFKEDQVFNEAKDFLRTKIVEWIFRSLEVQLDRAPEYSLEEVQRIIDLHHKKVIAKKPILSEEFIEQAQKYAPQDFDEEEEAEKQLEINALTGRQKYSKKSQKFELSLQDEKELKDLFGHLVNPRSDFNELQDAAMRNGAQGQADLIQEDMNQSHRAQQRLTKVIYEISKERKKI